ncbi:unnamed protein product, partial [Pylaiella littoralis]
RTRSTRTLSRCCATTGLEPEDPDYCCDSSIGRTASRIMLSTWDQRKVVRRRTVGFRQRRNARTTTKKKSAGRNIPTINGR